jgi:hypothetical protein
MAPLGGNRSALEGGSVGAQGLARGLFLAMLARAARPHGDPVGCPHHAWGWGVRGGQRPAAHGAWLRLARAFTFVLALLRTGLVLSTCCALLNCELALLSEGDV